MKIIAIYSLIVILIKKIKGKTKILFSILLLLFQLNKEERNPMSTECDSISNTL